ncbi:MAG TPA: CARDB domain-containing protein [Verrucomicrobiota bacterium]|nr:CARDB domain-containing protein [Verrucomicrobiota bacterium]
MGLRISMGLRNTTLVVVLCVAGLPGLWAQEHPVSTWTGSAGDNQWGNPGNWSPAGVPSVEGVAVINSGSPNATALGEATLYGVNLNGGTLTSAGLTVAVLNQKGGSLAGNHRIAAEGVWNWTHGWLYGSCTVSTAAVLNFADTATKELGDGAMVHNYGRIQWAGGTIRGRCKDGAATIHNYAGARFEMLGGAALTRQYGYVQATVVIDAGAECVKTDPASVESQWAFDVAGRFEQTAGALWLRQGGNYTGAIENGEGVVLGLGGGTHVVPGGVTVRGPGSVRFTAGAFECGGLLTLDGAVFRQEGGDFRGTGDGAVIASIGDGALDWAGGALYGSLTLTNGTQHVLSGTGEKYFGDGAALHNHGEITWTGGTIRARCYNAGATLHTHAGGRFECAGGDALARQYGYQRASFLVDSGAVFVKSDADWATSDWFVGSWGAFSQAAGTFSLRQGGEYAGTIENLGGAALGFAGGTHGVAGGTVAKGSGWLKLSAGQLQCGGLLALEGTTLSHEGGEFNGTGAGGAVLAMSGGGNVVWSSGTLYGTTTWTNGAVATLSGGGAKYFGDHAVLRNYGEATWTGGTIRARCHNGGAEFRNHAGARFECAGGAAWTRQYGYHAASFVNEGALVLSAPGCDVTSDWVFTQTGAGALEVMIAGTTAGTQHGRLVTSRSFALGGTLRTVFVDPFRPAPGDRFQFLDASPVSGGFGAQDLAPLPAGLEWILEATSSLVALRVAGEGVCVTPPAGLVAWWPGEGDARDLSGTNHGTLEGQVGFAEGQVGTCFRLDGMEDGVRVGNPAVLRLQDFTVLAWVRRAETTRATGGVPGEGGRGAVFSHGTGGYGFGLLNDGALYLSQIGSGEVNTGGLGVRDTNWHHVAVTKSGTAVAFYIDGSAAGAAMFGPVYAFTTAAGVGARGDTLEDSFLGDLDEVAVFQRALGASEIALLRVAGAAGMCAPSDLAVDVAAVPQPGVVGSNLVYTFTVVNQGPGRASNVTLTDTLPSALALVSVASSQGTVTNAGLTVTGWLQTLEPGAVATVTITTAPAAFGSVTNTGSVVAGEVDPATGNNAASAVVYVEPPDQDVLFVNVRGGVYEPEAAALFDTLNAVGARATHVDLDVNGEVAALLGSAAYDQVWVFDLSSGPDAYPADWQAIADWFAARPAGALICDARSLSSYWKGRAPDEGLRLTENYYENLKEASGGLVLCTDDDQFAGGINEVSRLLGLEPFAGQFNRDRIPVDTRHLLMTHPNDLGPDLSGDSSPGQAPFGLQPNGLILYTVAWHSGDTNAPGISSTLRGDVGFRVLIVSPGTGSQFNEEASVSFNGAVRGGQSPIAYAWRSDVDGPLGTGAALTLTALSPGTHRVTVVAEDAAGAADAASIVVVVRPLAPVLSLDLPASEDTGASTADNLTRLREPGIDAAVNKRGRIEFDATGDGGVDATLTNAAPGTFRFAGGPFADGPHGVRARFVPRYGEPVEATLGLVVDTAGPRVLGAQPIGLVTTRVEWIDLEFDTPVDGATFTPADVRLEGPSAPGVASIQSVSGNTWRVRLAAGLPAGQFNLAVGPEILDLAGNAMNQNGDAVNGDPAADVFSAVVTVDLADLEISRIDAPDTAQYGQVLAVSWTCFNRGEAPAGGAWVDRIHLSTQENVVAGAALLLEAPARSTLGSGASYTNTANVTLPLDLSATPGPRFLVVVADAGGTQPETDDANNVRSRILTLALPSFSLTARNEPAGGGTVSGEGTFLYGTTNLLTAAARHGYRFLYWTENGAAVGDANPLAVRMTGDRRLVAHYAVANLVHTITTATSPTHLAAVAGGGVYTNGDIAEISAPVAVTNPPTLHTFREFRLNGAPAGTAARFSKTLTELDPTNMNYVAVYDSASWLPLVVEARGGLTNAVLGGITLLTNPIPATTQYLIVLRFDRTMDPAAEPVIRISHAPAQEPMLAPTGGVWLATALPSDTYRTPLFGFGPGSDGDHAVFVSVARDTLGQTMEEARVLTLGIDATAPPHPPLTLAASNAVSATVTWAAYTAPSDLGSFLVYRETAPFDTLAGLTPVTALGAGVRSHTFAGLALDQPHYVAVAAVDAAGNCASPIAPLRIVLPVMVPPPVEISVAAPGPASARLTWAGYDTARLFGFAGFHLYTRNAPFTTVAGLTPQRAFGADARGVEIEGLDRRLEHYFAVVGFNRTNGFDPNVAAVKWTDPYSGTIAADTSLGGPGQETIDILDSITVVSNAVLTLAPGTTLRFAAGAALTVEQGQLRAEGTALDPIVFTSQRDEEGQTPAPGDWGGITLGAGAGGSVLRHVVVDYGAGLVVSHCAPTVEALTARYNTPAGLSVRAGGVLSTTAALIAFNSVGVLGDGANLELHESVLRNNTINATVVGGPAILASRNWWGSVVPAEIAAGISGAVETSNPLGFEPLLTPALGASNGVNRVGTRLVSLRLACRTAEAMRLSEDVRFPGVFFEAFAPRASFTLSEGGGQKTVYAQFRNLTGETSAPVSLEMTYVTAGPTIGGLSLAEGQVLNRPLIVTGSATAPLGVTAMELHLDGALVASQAGGALAHWLDVRLLGSAVHRVKLAARDAAGNLATIERNVVVAPTPPAAPVITLPEVDLTINLGQIVVGGTAEPFLEVRLTRNGVPVGITTASAAGEFLFRDVPLTEGSNELRAIAQDAIGSMASAVRQVVLDVGPPVALVLDAPFHQPGLGLGMSWRFAGEGERATSFEVLWHTAPFDQAEQATGRSGRLAAMNTVLTGLDDGEYHLAVLGYDAAGNPSPLSERVVFRYDTVAPAFAVVFDQAPPVGGGVLGLVLTASEPLAAPPSLTIRPNNRLPLLVALTNTAWNTYAGSIRVTTLLPSGPAPLQVTAEDLAGNRFTGAPAGPALVIDLDPPAGLLVTAPASPIQTTNDTPLAVTLRLDEAPKAGTVPMVTFTPPTGSMVPVVMQGEGVEWTGTLMLTAAMGSGLGQFGLEVTDALGNVGRTLTAGTPIEIYNTPLPPPPGQPVGFLANALAAGQVRLTWMAVADAEFYRIYREPGADAVSPTVLVGEAIPGLSWVDLPPADGSYRYAVAAVRRSSESGRSVTRVATSDRTPPPAPINVDAQLLNTGLVVRWADGPGEAPHHYVVYRNGQAIRTLGAGVIAVQDHPPRGMMSYAVAAADRLGNEGMSDAVSIQLAVSAVLNLEAQVQGDQPPMLSWTSDDPTVVGFRVYRNDIQQAVLPASQPRYTDPLPAGSARVTYRVTAIDATDRESVGRVVHVGRLQMALEANPDAEGVGQALVHRYFDRFHVQLSNATRDAALPVEAITLRRTVTGSSPLTRTVPCSVALDPGESCAAEGVFPCPGGFQAETILVQVAQATGVEGSRVTYSESFTFDTIDTLEPMIELAAQDAPLAGGLSTFEVRVFNRGHASFDLVLNRDLGRKPGDLAVSVKNAAGQEVSRAEFTGNAPGQIFDSGGTGFVRVAPGAFTTVTVTNVFVPEALAGTGDVTFEAIVARIYTDWTVADPFEAGPLTGQLVSGLVQTPYYGIAQTDRPAYANEDPVRISGEARNRVTGETVPDVPLRIGFAARGARWYREVTTDASGAFEHTYLPPAGFSGALSIWAAHPEIIEPLDQARVSFLRLYLTPGRGGIRMSKNSTLGFALTLVNPGDLPLSGLTVDCAAYRIEGTNTVAISTMTAATTLAPEFVLGANRRQSVEFRLWAAEDAPDHALVDLTLRSAEGAAATFRGVVTLLPAVPLVTVEDPAAGYVEVSLDRGGLLSRPVTIVNDGLDDLEGVSLVPPAARVWMMVNLPASPDGSIPLPNLAVGESTTFNVVFAPPADTSLGMHQDHVMVRGTNTTATFEIPLYAQVTTALHGSVQFYVENILSQPVPGASVRLEHGVLRTEVGPVTTDINGIVTVADLDEGDWRWQIVAAGHSTQAGVVRVIPDQVIQVGPPETRLTRSLVTVAFTVTPVPYTDRYEVTLEQTFETHVPAGVLVLDPSFREFRDVQPGFETTVLVKAQNKGLIQLEDVTFTGSTIPQGTLTPLIEYVPVILPFDEIEVPFRVVFTGQPASTGSGGGGSGGGKVGLAATGEGRQSWDLNELGDCIGGSWVAAGEAIGGLTAVAAYMNALAEGEFRCRSDNSAIVISTSLIMGLTCFSELFSNAYERLVSWVVCFGEWLIHNIANTFGFGDPSPKAKPRPFASTPPPQSVTTVNWKSPPCLAAGTRIRMADGREVPVETVRVGDRVRSDAELERCATVGEVSVRAVENLRELRWRARTDSSEAGPLRVTDEHLVWVDGRGWTEAVRVPVGAGLLDEHGRRVEVVANEACVGSARVYSLRLHGDTVHYANGVLVHEGCGYRAASAPRLPDATSSRGRGGKGGKGRKGRQGRKRGCAAWVCAWLGVWLALSAPARAQQQFQGVCAGAKIVIEQELTLERIGFLARLEVTDNDSREPITDFSAALTFENPLLSTNGVVNDATAVFFVRAPELENVTAVDGRGVIQPTRKAIARWFIIPKISAGGTSPDGVRYRVGCRLAGRMSGVDLPAEVLTVIADTIFVKPEPQLEITYFQPRDVQGDDPFTPEVESPIPFTLGVLVKNAGYGAAHRVRIDSQQPKIVENRQNLLLIARLLGARVDDAARASSLLLDLGDLEPGQTRKGAWDMITSLSGEFIEFKASYRHASELGGEETSVIKSLAAHFIAHEVLDDLPGRDDLKDFLADTDRDAEMLPDTLYGSDGLILPVHPVESASVTGVAAPGSSVEIRAVANTEGWGYVRLADPGQARLGIARVVRSDGRVINPNNVWTHVRYTRQSNARLAYLNLLDHVGIGAQAYTLTYAAGAADTNAPATTLHFAGPVVESNQRFYVSPETQMFFLSEDENPVSIYYSLTNSAFRPAVPFQLTAPGEYGLAYYATDAAGNREEDRTAVLVLSGPEAMGFAQLDLAGSELFPASDSLSVRPVAARFRFQAQPNPTMVTAAVDVFAGVLGFVTVANVPSSPTADTGADLVVGGEAVDFYSYTVDGGGWSADQPVGQPLRLSNLAPGAHSLAVRGRSRYGGYQAAARAVTVSWTVDPSAPPTRISGAPATPTRDTSATLVVGGAGVTDYRWTLDGGYYRPERAVAQPIELVGLDKGAHRLSVIGKVEGAWQAADQASTLAWTVDPGYGSDLAALEIVYHETLPDVGAGVRTFEWTGRNLSGALAPPGWYTVRLTLTDALGHTTFATRIVRVRDAAGEPALLADAARGPRNPHARGHWAVWQDQSDGFWQVYAVDLADPSRVIRPLTQGRLSQENPRTDGRYVVWQARQANGNWDLLLVDLESSGAPVPITGSAAIDEIRPAIDWPWVVCSARSSLEPRAPWLVQARNLRTGATFAVSPGNADQLDPDVHAGRVVWQDFRDVGYGEIYYADLEAGEERRLTIETHGQYHPVVFGDWVVWQDNRHGQVDLYGIDRRRQGEIRLTDTAENESMPRLDGPWLVFEEDSMGADTLNLRLLHLPTRQVFPVTHSVSLKTQPSLAGAQLVWQDADAGACRLLTAEIPFLQPVFANANAVAVTRPMAAYAGSAHTLLTHWHAAAGVTEITRYVALVPQVVTETVQWVNGQPAGPDFALEAGGFLWIRFNQARVLDLGLDAVGPLSLPAGLSVFSCARFPSELTAFGLLRQLGLENARGLRLLDAESGRWRVALVQDGALVGQDFPIPKVAVLMLDLVRPIQNFQPR